ncbi:N-6 DNA methylase [Flavobacterium sp. Arc2]|uniref:N-6 DNA methylase n=1 Tax=Flavobacterium sp. Arc2 TaxID=3046685 RepID=UPI00352EA0EF
MNNTIEKLLTKINSQGLDYKNFKVLINEIEISNVDISKDDLLDLVVNDRRIHLHTTSNQIGKLIAEIANEKESKNALDICCGTGNLLYYLQNQIEDLSGIEIDENVAALTNYIIDGVNVITADSFQYSFSKKYDLVVGNLPWGMPIVYQCKTLKSEEAFIRKAFELVNDTGDLIFIVPVTILNSAMYQSFREEYGMYLNLVIELPNNIVPFSGLKSALIRFSKNKKETISLGKIDSFQIPKSYQEYIIKEISNSTIGDRWDVDYYINQDKEIYKELEGFTTKSLKDIAEIVKGVYLKSDQHPSKENYIYLSPVHIKDGKLNVENARKFIDKSNISDSQNRYILKAGDIVISTIFNDLKMYVYRENDPPAIASNNLAIIRSNNDDYIVSYLKTEEGKRIFSEQAKDLTTGNIIPHINIKDIQSIRIPILPLSDLNSIGNIAIENASSEELLLLEKIVKSYKNQIDELKSENESLKINKSFINDRFDRIEKQLEIVNTKLDSLLLLIQDLSKEFQDIKSSGSSPEDKLSLLCSELDSKIEILLENNIDQIKKFEIMLSKWFAFEWDKLENLSKSYLPTAELLFSQLSKLDNADLSPFIIQYCRALENELLQKVFRSYIYSLKERNLNIEIAFAWDFGKKESGNLNSDNTYKIVKHLKNCLRNEPDKWFFELGSMETYLRYLNGETVNKSPVLQDIKKFVLNYFENNILDLQFLDELKRIKNDYRNKAAHPNKINVEEAQKGQMEIRTLIKSFLEYYK